MSRSKLAFTPSQQKWHADSDLLFPSLGSTFALESCTAMTQFAPPSEHSRPCLFKSAKAYAAHMHPLWESVVGTNVHGAVVVQARKRRCTGGHVAPSSMEMGDMVLFDTSRPHRGRFRELPPPYARSQQELSEVAGAPRSGRSSI
jgi:hypothetical protein